MINQLTRQITFSAILIILSAFDCLAIDFLVPANKLAPKAWNPVTEEWSNETIKGYAETQTTAQVVEIQNLEEINDSNLKLILCLHTQVLKLTPSDTFYAFTEFNTWNTTYHPTTLPDGSPMPVASSTQDSIQAINANILSVSTPSTSEALCPNIGDDKYLGLQVVFTKINPNLNAYLLYGGKLSKVGSSLPTGLLTATVPADKSSSFINGLSENFNTAVVGSEGLKFVPFGNISLEPGIQLTKSVTLPEGQCGVDDLEELSVVSNTNVKFCFKVTNTAKAPLLNVNLNDDTLVVNLSDSLVGLTDQDADGQADDLAIGSWATAEYSYTINESLENSATASGSAINSQDQSAVRISICGNEVVEAGEECDTLNGCTANCTFEDLCGNQEIDPGEDCDSTEGCNSNCQFAVCGNGIVEEDAGEQCDHGKEQTECSSDEPDCFENQKLSEAPPVELACSDTCLLEICGNGILDSGEECDDSNQVNGDNCSASCLQEVCGNGVLDYNEECDYGDTLNGDGCSSFCRLEVCGNGIVDLTEQCDDGNATLKDGCSNICQLEEDCQDGKCAPTIEIFNCVDENGQQNNLDRCQGCGGDGLSCISCVSKSNIEDQLKMDGASKQLAILIKNLNNNILKRSITDKLKKDILESNLKVEDLYLTSWSLSWSLPMITKACSSVFCTTEDLSGLATLYKSKLLELVQEARKSSRIFKRLTGKKKSAQKFLSAVNEQYDSGIQTAGNVTTATSVCF